MKPKCADLFCGAGGAAVGLHRSGFKVTGWDIDFQPHYPFGYHLQHALNADLRGFDFVWASPPCQRYTRMNRGLLKSLGTQKDYPDMIADVRSKLKAWGGLYVIENVKGAPLINPFMLCGSSFGMHIQRHRLFESNFMVLERPCVHGFWDRDKHPVHRLQGKSRIIGCYGHSRGKGDNVGSRGRAMGIDWMTMDELSEAIPPAYSEYIGRQAIRLIQPALASNGA